MNVVIVGAGVAGLVCGRTLQRAGHSVVVLEGSDGVGGRVRSDTVEGFTLERGFQVLFTAYPAARRQLDYDRLDLRRFDPGAIISRGARRHVLSDPLRDPGALLASLATGIVTVADKAKTALLAAELLQKSVDAIMDEPDETTESFLRRHGFSPRFIENFARPFFGGVFLDDSLQTSAKAFQFDWKMLCSGDTTIPARGMGKISEQIAEELAATNSIRLNTRVTELVQEGGRWIGARTENDETVTGDAVVVATPAPEAARLTGRPMPEGQTSTVNLFFAGSAPVYSGRKMVLHSNQRPFVRGAVQITNVAPEHAPPGRHLLSASILGVPEGSDDELFARGMADLRRIWAGDGEALDALSGYRPLAIYRIPYGQFAQRPGVYERLPDNDGGEPGLFFAGEFTAASSFNAAMRSGEKAAERIEAVL
jgi:phytoene dehydrogenase-like protein